jgi:hypothetical protein
MTNKDVSKVKRKGTFKSAPLPEKAQPTEILKGEELVKVAVRPWKTSRPRTSRSSTCATSTASLTS